MSAIYEQTAAVLISMGAEVQVARVGDDRGLVVKLQDESLVIWGMADDGVWSYTRLVGPEGVLRIVSAGRAPDGDRTPEEVAVLISEFPYEALESEALQAEVERLLADPPGHS